MSDCTDVLGIAPDADLQEIKRAYARALKLNRPDDDPEAFARVQEAFEACVARFKRRQAGVDEESDWSDEDEWIEEDGLPAMGSAATFEPTAEEGSAQAGTFEAVEAILDAASTMPFGEFRAWLRADERLYDLAFKRGVGDLVIERMTPRADELDWRAMAVLYEFFEVDSVSDPRLRSDYMARSLWTRVQADLRFDRTLRARRAPYAVDTMDAMVFAELFDAPARKRFILMHLVPWLPGQLRSQFKQLSALDPERAEAALSSRARDYWLPLTDPARLNPRRVGLVMLQCVLGILPLALLISAPEFGRKFFKVWSIFAAVIFGVWLLRTTAVAVWAQYTAWRLRTVGAGEAPVGASMFADRVTVLAGGSALASLALSIGVLMSGNATLGLMVQVWLLMVGVVAFRGTRFRWEALLAAVAAAACAYPHFRWLGGPQIDERWLAVSPGALAAGILVVLVVDALHARLSRQALADVRDGLSVPQCLLAVSLALIAWFL
jgi:hypothetical protein